MVNVPNNMQDNRMNSSILTDSARAPALVTGAAFASTDIGHRGRKNMALPNNNFCADARLNVGMGECMQVKCSKSATFVKKADNRHGGGA